MAIECLSSLAKYHQGPVQFLVHEDGSMTDDDESLMIARLPHSRVIRRKQADERMAEELRRFPASAAFRKETCMGLKLCDTVYYNQNEIYAYSDTDVLFLRPFEKMFELPDPAVNALFMHDPYESAYSFRSWQLLTARSVRLPKQVNSGLSCLRRSKYDPEFVEWFLAGPARGGKRHHGVPEQTAWAAIGMAVGCRKWHPDSVALGMAGLQVNPQLIAAHFVGMFRSYMPEYMGPNRYSNDAPIQPKTIAATRCTSFHLAYDESRKVISRVRQKWARR
jgi:hypothetical protein